MNEKQRERYSRHTLLAQIGEEGQQKLLDARVLVIGAGGLGAPIIQYLMAAGVGTLGIVDADVVSLSNLQRQVLYREDQLGQPKTEMLRATMAHLNSDVKLITYPFWLIESNVCEIVAGYDMVVGATDNFASRRCIDRVTREQGKPFIHGSIGEFEGQVSVFNFQGGISYSELFPDTPDEKLLPKGVMGVLPGIIGSLQACEVIKIVVGIGEVLSGKLLVYNALTCEMRKFEL